MAGQISNDVLAERMEGVKEDVQEIKIVVKEMSETMSKLVDVERRQSDQQTVLAEHGSRISVIERKLPGLLEVRSWIVRGVLAIVGIAVLAVFKLH